MASTGGRASRGPDGRYHDVALHARSSVLLAAAAAGVAAIDAVWLALEDREGQAAEAADAAASGFAAKACVHPSHVAPIRAAFKPSPEELIWAEDVLALAAEQGSGVFIHEGRMIDEPLLRHARVIAGVRAGDGIA